MSVSLATDLLTEADGPPVAVTHPDASGSALVVCEHAAHRLPARLGDLGLPPDLRSAHIAWDPGALGVAEGLAAALDAPLVAARFSRLAYDCNRPPEAPDAIAARSEVFDIPGNAGLNDAERAARAATFYHPFRATLSGLIGRRLAAGRAVALVTVHSFTPVFMGQPRTVEIGVLHDADNRLADRLLARLAAAGRWQVARNAPYGPEDGVTHTLRDQALPRGLLNVMLEIRNDLIATPAAQAEMAAALAAHLAPALTAPEAA
ncbi:MAG: N-formylglutamate amidohydrolase [Alphaproteobacteria bacterium HGW-Alphaproteobacteria-2]|nr:MAG: N-formylglutamate amidohydrolase [Alphaproteobacteria bacterium HGW-Alphaproteobacteria-2]